MPTVIGESIAYTPAALNTEYDIPNCTDTSDKNYVLVVDTDNMQNADVLELKIYTKVLTTSATTHLAYYAVYAHDQAHPVKYSVPVPAHWYIRCTINQKEGTLRAYDCALWSVT